MPGVLEVGAEPVGTPVQPTRDILGEAVGYGVSLMFAVLIGALVSMHQTTSLPTTPSRDSYAPSADTREVGVRVVSLQIGDDAGEESHEVIHETREFKRDCSAIYVTAFVNGVSPGARVRATLVALGKKKGSDKVVAMELGASAEGFPSADVKLWFKFLRHGESWAAGRYEVRLATDTGAIGKVQITVR
jgi:hypothetical protein